MENENDIKRIGFWFLIGLVITGSLIYLVFSQGDVTTNVPGEQPAARLSTPVSNSDWSKGNKDAATTIVEYSDFQCPACGAYYPIVKEFVQQNGDNVNFVYRHYPLNQIHPNAQLAAQATEAAGMQGKFWEMHDALFEGQADWSSQSSSSFKETLTGYAEEHDLDIEKFLADLESDQVVSAVNADISSGNNSQVRGTPTFFVNGTAIKNPQSLAEFESYLTPSTSEDAMVDDAMMEEDNSDDSMDDAMEDGDAMMEEDEDAEVEDAMTAEE